MEESGPPATACFAFGAADSDVGTLDELWCDRLMCPLINVVLEDFSLRQQLGRVNESASGYWEEAAAAAAAEDGVLGTED